MSHNVVTLRKKQYKHHILNLPVDNPPSSQFFTTWQYYDRVTETSDGQFFSLSVLLFCGNLIMKRQILRLSANRDVSLSSLSRSLFRQAI